MTTNYKNAILKVALSSLFLLIATAMSFGQTTIIYSENFTGQDGKGANGTWNNNPNINLNDVDWTIDVSSADLRDDDWFRVMSGRLEARDTDGEVVWYSPTIDISTHSLVYFSLNASENGRQESDDYFITEYRLNNSGNWILASNNGNLSDDFGSRTVSQLGLSGTQLEIRVRIKNNDGKEYHRLDNIIVEAQPLFFEDFEDEDDTNGTDLIGTNWNTNTSEANPETFEVRNGNYFESEETNGPAYWYTGNINIQNYVDLNLSSFIEFNRIDNDGDYIKFYYKLDGGSLEVIETLTGPNSNTTYDWNLTGVSGNNLQIWVEFNSDDEDDRHRIDNIKLTGVPCTTPTAFNITGNNLTYCEGDSANTTIGLNNSQSGVTYQLLRDNTPVSGEGAVRDGDNGAITFAPVSAPGTYTVLATRTDGGCTADMIGEVVITVNTATAAFTALGTAGINQDINIVNTSEGEGNLYTWSFGDGSSSSTLETPTHFYTDAGTYTITLIVTNACGTDTISRDIIITETVVTYCEVEELNAGDFNDGITSVVFGDINNPTGIDNEDGYIDYSSISTTLMIGSTEDLIVNLNTDGDAKYYARAWIDWNMDGYFDTDSERYDLGFTDSNSNGKTSESPKTIEVPSNATIGITRMRIISAYNGYANTACFVNNGEIEDYSIIIEEQTNNWVGSIDDYITETEHWSLGIVPDETQSIKIKSGSHLNIEDDKKFVSVTVETGGALTITKSGSVTTTKDFTNNGTVNMLSELKSGFGMQNQNANANARDQFSSLFVRGVASGEITYHRATRANRASQGSPVLRNHVSSPVANEIFNQSFVDENPDITASTSTTGAYIFFTWLNSIGNWSFNYASQPAPLVPGKGYMVGMGSANGNNPGNPKFELKFTGQIQNAAQVDIAIDDNYNPWQVVGNPYAAYLDMDLFLDYNINSGAIVSENSSMTGIYAWTGEGNSTPEKYKVYNKMSNSNLIRPGQGFVVRSSGGGGVITFKKEWLRLPNAENANDIDPNFSGRFSTPTLNNYIRLKLTSDNRFPMETEVYFNDEFGTNGLDVAYDTEVYGGQAGNNFGIYTHLIEGSTGKDFAIQTIDNSNLHTHSIPLGVNLNAGMTATISLADLLLPENTTVYLEDRAANVWTILNNVDYTFTAATNLTDTGRFFIHFEDNSSTLSNNEFDLNKLDISSLAGQKTVVVNGQLDSDSVLELYDMMGRVVLTKSLKSYQTTHNIDASQLPVAAYIVKVSNNTQKISKQILIN